MEISGTRGQSPQRLNNLDENSVQRPWGLKPVLKEKGLIAELEALRHPKASLGWFENQAMEN
jgi:hypothetical protein